MSHIHDIMQGQGIARHWLWSLLGAALLIGLCVDAYIPAIGAGFIWDDGDHVTGNITFTQPDALRRIWLEPGTAPQYYPLAHTIFLAEYLVAGGGSTVAISDQQAAVGHMINIALHAANVLLLWLILRRLAVPGAWFAAALWGIHPVNVESVAWVTELKNVLSGFFYLLAALAYLRFCGSEERPPRSRPWGFYLLALGLFVLALWSKTVTASLPAAIMIVLWWKGNRVGWREAIPAASAALLGYPLFLGIFRLFRLVGNTSIAAPRPHALISVQAATAKADPGLSTFLTMTTNTLTLAIVVAALLALAAWWLRWRIRWREILPLCPFFMLGMAQGQMTAFVEKSLIGAEGFDWQFSFLQRVFIAGRALSFYAWSLIWPSNLIFMYPKWNIDPHGWWPYAFPLAAAAVLAGLWFFRAGRRGPVAAAAFFAMTLVPALGFVDVYPFRYSYVADHFQYLASVGLITLGAAGAARILTRFAPAGMPMLPRLAGGAVGGVLVLSLSFLSFQQAKIYTSLETLWVDTLAKNPTCWIALNNLGGMMFGRNDLGQAMKYFDWSLAINPRNGEAYNNRALVWERWAQQQQRSDFYDLALNEYNKAVDYSQRLMSPRENRAHLLMALNRHEAALNDLSAIIAQVPPFRAYNVYLYRAQVYMVQDRYEPALADCDVAAQIPAATATAFKIRGDIYRQMAVPRRPLDPPGRVPPLSSIDALRQAVADYSAALEIWSKYSAAKLRESGVSRSTLGMVYGLRAMCRYGLHQYDLAWEDVRASRQAGGNLDPNFLRELAAASGHSQ